MMQLCREHERLSASSWDDFPDAIEESLAKLKSSYQRRHHLDAPLGFDDSAGL